MDRAPTGFFYKMMRKKNIVLNGKKASGGEKLHAGDQIKLFLSQETIEKFSGAVPVSLPEPQTELAVLYEDDHVLLVNKPVGMLSQKAKASDVSLVELITSYLFYGKSDPVGFAKLSAWDLQPAGQEYFRNRNRR